MVEKSLAGRAARLPWELTKFSLWTGAAVTRHLRTGILGNRLDAAEIDVRIQQQPLHDVRIGVETVLKGERTNEAELKHLGAAMIVHAVLDAQESDNVPPDVTQAVVETVLEIDDEVDLRLQDSAQIPASQAERAILVISRLSQPAK